MIPTTTVPRVPAPTSAGNRDGESAPAGNGLAIDGRGRHLRPGATGPVGFAAVRAA